MFSINVLTAFLLCWWLLRLNWIDQPLIMVDFYFYR